MTSTSPRRPQAKIYTHSPPTESVRVCQADLIESDSGNYDLSIATVRSILTLNHGEVNELNFVAHEAQRLQIPLRDYDHAMILLNPDQIQQEPRFDQQPILLAAANVNQLLEGIDENVSRYDEELPRPQHTQLITPIPEHMAKVEQEIPVYEYINTAGLTPPKTTRLHETPANTNLSPLNSSRTSMRPTIFNASRVQLLEPSRTEDSEDLPRNDFYQRRLRGIDLLRQVENDPNANIRPSERGPMNVMEHSVPVSNNVRIGQAHTVYDDRRITRPSIEQTDEPVVYETIDIDAIGPMPTREQLFPVDSETDQLLKNRSQENQIRWREHQAYGTEHYRDDEKVEYTTPIPPASPQYGMQMRLREERSETLQQPTHGHKNSVLNYGE